MTSFLNLITNLFCLFLGLPLLAMLAQELMIIRYPTGSIVCYTHEGRKTKYWVVLEHYSYNQVYLQPFSTYEKSLDIEPSLSYNRWSDTEWGTESVKYGQFRKITQLEKLLYFS